MVRICVHVRIFGPSLWALLCLGLLNRGVGPKSMVPTVSTSTDDNNNNQPINTQKKLQP